MTSLELSLPEPWVALSGHGGGRATVAELTAGVAQLGSVAQSKVNAYLNALLAALSELGVDGFAALALPDPDSGELVQAVCAFSSVVGRSGDADELTAIATSGPHPGLDRETTSIQLAMGAAVRSSAFRWAAELRDSEGVAPYSFEVRFAFPIRDGRVGVLHFETLSLVYLQELERMFDSIAGTARVA